MSAFNAIDIVTHYFRKVQLSHNSILIIIMARQMQPVLNYCLCHQQHIKWNGVVRWMRFCGINEVDFSNPKRGYPNNIGLSYNYVSQWTLLNWNHFRIMQININSSINYPVPPIRHRSHSCWQRSVCIEFAITAAPHNPEQDGTGQPDRDIGHR